MIKYVRFGVSIHGIQVQDPAAVEFLKGWIRAETVAGLTGHQKSLFNFRDEFDSDVEVEIEETAGSYGPDLPDR